MQKLVKKRGFKWFFRVVWYEGIRHVVVWPLLLLLLVFDLLAVPGRWCTDEEEYQFGGVVKFWLIYRGK